MVGLMTEPYLSVVVPVHNEEKHIEAFLDQLRSALLNCPFAFEVIVVNDGSTDKTHELILKLEQIKLINHDTNRGYGSAIKSGILAASADKILITDADGTYPTEKIADLLKYSQDYDMVVGARIVNKTHHSKVKRLAKWPIHLLANYLVGFKIPDLNSGLRIFRKDLALKYFRLLPNGFSLTTNITLAFLADGYRVKYIPIDYHKRVGKSKVHPIRDAVNYLVLVMRMILFYNPLKFFVPVAGVFFALSAWSFLYDIIKLDDLTEKTLILFVAFVQITILGFLADLINKRGMD